MTLEISGVLIQKALRIDDEIMEEDREYIDLLKSNALYFIEDSTEIEESEMTIKAKSKCTLLALMLMSDWYENREMTTKVSEKKRLSVDSLIKQINYGG